MFSDHPVAQVQHLDRKHDKEEIHLQKVLAAVHDTRADSPMGDDDNMTEITSRTDDDVLRDAFRFLDASGEEDDEIVWDPRYRPLYYSIQ